MILVRFYTDKYFCRRLLHKENETCLIFLFGWCNLSITIALEYLVGQSLVVPF